MTYVRRVLEHTLKRYLANFSAVGLTGPRQSGKSTMLKHLLSDSYQYVNFDDYSMIDFFHSDPKRFMRVYGDGIIFDEVQKVPEIFSYIKLEVDSDRKRPGKFVLTGSSQFSFMKKITESLAGRIGLLSLLPFQFEEVPAILREESIFRGSFPEIVMKSYKESNDWYSSYVETYLNRDVRDLSNIGEMREFRRCLQLLAARTAQILNLSELARDIGIAVNTVKKWVSILEASYIITLLPPFYQNLGKRIIKTPKVYFLDTGLVSFLTGITTTEIFEKGPMQGALFENYVISEIIKRERHTRSDADLYYFRTSSGLEVDLIIDRKTTREYVEIKSSETFRPDMIRSLEKIKKQNENAFLVYRGTDTFSSDTIHVVNYSKYLTDF